MSLLLGDNVEDIIDAVLDDRVSLHALVTEAFSVGDATATQKASKVLYLAALAKSCQLLRSSRDIGAWRTCRDSLLRCESWLRASAFAELAERVAAFYDLFEDVIRLANQCPSPKLLDRAHVVALLEYIRNGGGEAPRENARKNMGLKDANFTRLLNLIEAERLIERKVLGRSRRLLLTEIGQKVLLERCALRPEHEPTKDSWNSASVAYQLLGDANSQRMIGKRDVGLIERDIRDLKEVFIILNTINEPQGIIADAVIDNFIEGVEYHFFVSKSNYQESLKRSEAIYRPLLLKAEALQGHKNRSGRPWHVHNLHYDHFGFPYIFYSYISRKDNKIFGFRGDKKCRGIADHYTRIHVGDAYAMLSILKAQYSQKHNALAAIDLNATALFDFDQKDMPQLKNRPPELIYLH